MLKVRPYLWQDLVRLGRPHDGGYVVPGEIVRRSSFLLSLGYGNDYSFEKDYLQLSSKSKVVLVDDKASVLFLFFNLVLSLLKRLTFNGGHPRAALKEMVMFLSLKRIKDIHIRRNRVASSQVRKRDQTLSTLIEIFETSELVLKMDIEGYEYECLLEAKDLSNLSCLVVEFHDIPNKQDLFEELLSKIKNHFILINAHINNFGKIINGVPEAIELSFINRRFVMCDLPLVDSIPSDLDQRNSVRFSEVYYHYR